jgi:hypothetical protein
MLVIIKGTKIYIPTEVGFNIIDYLSVREMMEFIDEFKLEELKRELLYLNKRESSDYYFGRYEYNPYKSIIHTLNLSCCKGITDVSALGAVHTLNLGYCRNITDVSALGAVHDLNLRFCDNITDVSSLGSVHTLNLSWCTGITDVSSLGAVHTLNLSFSDNITDVSALGGVHTLYLYGCDIQVYHH